MPKSNNDTAPTVTGQTAKAQAWQPPALDSILIRHQQQDVPFEELAPGQFYVAQSVTERQPLGQRVYHAWLLLQGKAQAFQYMRQHLDCRGATPAPVNSSEIRYLNRERSTR